MRRFTLGFPDSEEVAQYAAREFVRRSRAAVDARGGFRVALAGGSTPRRTYELLAQAALAPQVDWEATHIFFGDERAVAPDHPDSNYRSALEALLSKVNVPDAQVHRMAGESRDLATAAAEYEAALSKSFGVEPGSGFPRFDLVLLGMGTDGHTASLFPGTQALSETSTWVVANEVPQMKTRRLTMTAPLLNAAHCVMFLVDGTQKAESLARVLEGPLDASRFPSQLIEPSDGDLLWLVDQAAATHLGRKPEGPSNSRPVS